MKRVDSPPQIIGFTKQVDADMAIAEQARENGFSLDSFYASRAKYGGMEAEDAKRLKEPHRTPWASQPHNGRKMA